MISYPFRPATAWPFVDREKFGWNSQSSNNSKTQLFQVRPQILKLRWVVKIVILLTLRDRSLNAGCGGIVYFLV